MTGGGAYNLDRSTLSGSFVNSGGGFRCLSNISAGLFSGCLAGQGVRWDTAALLGSTVFQCTGSDAVKTAFTGNKTVVLLADFYRQGDGNIESFTAKMIVSDSDLDPVAPGVQNVWISRSAARPMPLSPSTERSGHKRPAAQPPAVCGGRTS